MFNSKVLYIVIQMSFLLLYFFEEKKGGTRVFIPSRATFIIKARKSNQEKQSLRTKFGKECVIIML